MTLYEYYTCRECIDKAHLPDEESKNCSDYTGCQCKFDPSKFALTLGYEIAEDAVIGYIEMDGIPGLTDPENEEFTLSTYADAGDTVILPCQNW